MEPWLMWVPVGLMLENRRLEPIDVSHRGCTLHSLPVGEAGEIGPDSEEEREQSLPWESQSECTHISLLDAPAELLTVDAIPVPITTIGIV